MTIITVTLNTSVDRTLEVPCFAVGAHLKGRLVRMQPGGKGVNVARCLAALGVPAVVTGLVGRSELPLFRRSFRGTLVRVELVPIAGPTRTNTTILDPEGGTDTHIREAGSPVTSEEVGALRAKLRGLASSDALVAFCGSLPPGMGDAQLRALLATARERGARLAADLNGPQLAVALATATTPPVGPPHKARRRAAMIAELNNSAILLIKPNVGELGECLGRDLSEAGERDLVAAAQSLLGRVGTVLVTRGSEGALAVGRSEVLAGAVEAVAPRNTVGCGDAFLAGYLAGMWRGQAPAEALRLAVACGAAQAEAEAPGNFSAARVAELALRARLRPIPWITRNDPRSM